MGNATSSEEADASVHAPRCVKDLFIPAEAADARRYGNFDVVTEHIEVYTNEDVPAQTPYSDVYGKYYCCNESCPQGREMWQQETQNKDEACTIQWSREQDAWVIRSGNNGTAIYSCICKEQGEISTLPRTGDVEWISIDEEQEAPAVTVKFEVSVPVNSEGQGSMGLVYRLFAAKAEKEEETASGAISSMLGDKKDRMKVLEHHGDTLVERSSMTINHVIRTPWLVDNSNMRATTRGLSFRTCKDVTSKALDRVAPWGSTVNGVNMGDGWLVVGQSSSWNTYLPFKVNGLDVLKPQSRQPAMNHLITGQFKNISGELMLTGCGCIYQVTENGKTIYDITIGRTCKLFHLFLHPDSPDGVASEAASVENKPRKIDDANYLVLQINAEAGLDSALVLTICLATLRQLPAHDDTTFDNAQELRTAEQSVTPHDHQEQLEDALEEIKQEQEDEPELANQESVVTI